MKWLLSGSFDNLKLSKSIVYSAELQFIILRLSFVALGYYLNKPFNHLIGYFMQRKILWKFTTPSITFSVLDVVIGIRFVNSNTYFRGNPLFVKSVVSKVCITLYYKKNLLPIVLKLILFDLLGHNFFYYYKIFPILVQS